MNGTMFSEASRARLQLFAFGSVLLHGIILAGWQTAPRLAGQVNNVISVTLVSRFAGAAPAEAHPDTRPKRTIAGRRGANASDIPAEPAGAHRDHVRALARPAAKTESTRLDPRDKEARFVAEKNLTVNDLKQEKVPEASRPATPSAPVSGEEVGRNLVHAQIRARLRTDLARYFDYPYVARLRGWEGTVLLGLRVEADGRLDRITIERSSGYALLDHSALNSLARLGRLAEASQWLDGRDMDMQLPVIYRLLDN